MVINASVTNQQITASVGETQIDVTVSGGVGPTGPSGSLGSAAQAFLLSRANHTGVQPISSIDSLQSFLDAKASLVGGRVPASQLPSFVDDVIEFSSLSAFPVTGEAEKIYVSRANNKIYRWSGTTYIEINASPGTTDSVPEGTGNLYHTTTRARNAAPVQSVAGKIGNVELAFGDVKAAVGGYSLADNDAGPFLVQLAENSYVDAVESVVGGIHSNNVLDVVIVSGVLDQGGNPRTLRDAVSTAYATADLAQSGVAAVAANFAAAPVAWSANAAHTGGRLYTHQGVVYRRKTTGSAGPTFNASQYDAQGPDVQHSHGSITHDGKIGTTSGRVAVTGEDGVLTTATLGSGLTLSGGTLTAAGGGGGAVNSVAGRTGDVTLSQADVGLGNVPNVDARARSTHTGTQTLSTISDAGSAAGRNVPAVGSNASTEQVVLGSDTRLSDSRTPSSHSHGNITNSGLIGGNTLSGRIVVTTTGGALTTEASISGSQVLSEGDNGSFTLEDLNVANLLGYIKASNFSGARSMLGLGSLATQSGTFSGASSGTNTGDQTISLTGDVTGSGTGSFAATLANTAVTAGSYGSGTAVATFSVDAKGRLTAAGTASITPAGIGAAATSHAHGNLTSAGLIGSNTASGRIVVTTTGGALTTAATIASGSVSGLATVATSGSYNDLSNKPSIPSAYTLPTASASVLGGVKIGSGISIDGSGVISASSGYTLPAATNTTLGGVNVAAAGSNASTSQVVRGDDTRLTDSRSPTSHSHGNLTSSGLVGSNTATGQFVTTTTNGALSTSDASGARTLLGLGSLATQNGTFSGTSSGTNTGDQTITLTGDVTGSGTGSFAATLANTAVTAGSYGSGTAVSTFTVDAKGRLTAAGTATITPAGIGAAATSHTQAFSTITSTPTTLSGYGITDAASSTHTHGNLTSSGLIGSNTASGQIVVTTTGGALTTAATISSSQVSGLGSLATQSSVAYSSLTGIPSTFTPASHTHSAAEITSGTVAAARLGSGSPSSANFLRGDGTWASAGSTSASDLTSGTLADARLSANARQAIDNLLHPFLLAGM